MTPGRFRMRSCMPQKHPPARIAFSVVPLIATIPLLARDPLADHGSSRAPAGGESRHDDQHLRCPEHGRPDRRRAGSRIPGHAHVRLRPRAGAGRVSVPLRVRRGMAARRPRGARRPSPRRRGVAAHRRRALLPRRPGRSPQGDEPRRRARADGDVLEQAGPVGLRLSGQRDGRGVGRRRGRPGLPARQRSPVVVRRGGMEQGRLMLAAPPTGLLVHVGNAACGGAFVVGWVATAVYERPRAPRRRARSTDGLAIRFAAIVPCAVLVLVALRYADGLTVDALWLRVVGLVVLVASTAFSFWARFALGTMWSVEAVVRERHELRTQGPYAITRNPIYTGMLGMFLGSTLLGGIGRWVFLVPLG